VNGLIGTLFKPKDVEETGVALTQWLGARVFNHVVVETEDVSKKLIKFG
jgi:chromosome segregation ATPase